MSSRVDAPPGGMQRPLTAVISGPLCYKQNFHVPVSSPCDMALGAFLFNWDHPELYAFHQQPQLFTRYSNFCQLRVLLSPWLPCSTKGNNGFQISRDCQSTLHNAWTFHNKSTSIIKSFLHYSSFSSQVSSFLAGAHHPSTNWIISWSGRHYKDDVRRATLPQHFLVQACQIIALPIPGMPPLNGSHHGI